MAGRLEEIPRDVLIRQQGHKDDYEKVNYFCVPWEAVNEMAEVMTFGAKKYEQYNFRKGMKASRLFSAAIRHLYAWLRREEVDPESGKSHLAHAACCVLMLRDIEMLGKVEDDRWRNADRSNSSHS